MPSTAKFLWPHLAHEWSRSPERVAQTLCFPVKTGQGRVDIRARFHRALREAGIEGLVFHDLRHTFASYLVMAGIDFMSVKELIWHKTHSMTLRYSHLAPDYKRAAISRLDTYMDPAFKVRCKWLK